MFIGHYSDKLLEVANKILESDYPAVEEVEVSTVRKARRMLDVLSASAPLTPNMEKLYSELGTDRKTFVLNQLRAAGHRVTYPNHGDFCIDDLWLFGFLY